MANNLSSWRQMTLDEICSGNLQTGPFGSQLKAEQYCDEGIPVFMPKDLLSNRAVTASAAKIPPETAIALNKHKLIEGDILFSRRGDIARFALIDKETSNGICGTGCLRARPDSTYDSLFISYALQQDTVKDWLTDNAVGQTMLNLNTTILSALPLDIPPEAEQTKIAQILSTWDKAIATTERLLANSQQQKELLTHQLLTGQQRFSEFVVSKDYQRTFHGPIPSDWNYVPIAEIANQQSKANSTQADLPVLSCSKYDGLVDSLKYFKKKVYSDDTSKYRVVEFGDFAYPSNHIEEGSIGYQDVYPAGIVSPIYTVFRTTDAVDDYFLYRTLKTDKYRQIFSAATSASVDRRGSLRWKEFSKILVPLPPLPEQQKIAQVLSTADAEISNLQAQLAKLKLEKKALMQQLLTGQRRVKPDAQVTV